MGVEFGVEAHEAVLKAGTDAVDRGDEYDRTYVVVVERERQAPRRDSSWGSLKAALDEAKKIREEIVAERLDPEVRIAVYDDDDPGRGELTEDDL